MMNNINQNDRHEVKQHIWRNFFSNYFRILLQLIFGFLIFRLLFQKLSAENYGIWVLLWSLIAYGKFLDFGFGFTIQKRVAELSAHQDWDTLKKLINTVFFTYFLIGLIILIITFAFSDPIVDLFKISPDKKEMTKDIFRYFFFWVALGYPLGIFPEILVGQQRISLLNAINSVMMCLNFFFLVIALYLDLGLKTLFTVSLACLVLESAIAGFYALQRLDNIRFRLRYYSWKLLRHNMNFSIFAYLNTICSTLIDNIGRLSIGMIVSVSLLPFYQAGAKIGEIFTNFTRQFADTLSPAAAHFHAKGDSEGVQELLLYGVRFSQIVATPLYILILFFMPEILRLLTGLKELQSSTIWTAQILLLWNYSMILTHRVLKTVLFMAGKEKIITAVNFVETIGCLTLTILGAFYYQSLVAVSLGLFIPTFIIGWTYLWPWTAQIAGIGCFHLARRTLFPVWIACLPMILALFLMHHFIQTEIKTHFFLFILEVTLGILVGICGIWNWVFTKEERRKIKSKMSFI